ncbi:VWA domain-containing protein, partial [Solirubrobacter deserti]
GAAGRTLRGAEARAVVRERGRRTLARRQLAHRHAQLERVSPEVGRLDEAALHELLGTDPDAAVALLADLAAATDPRLRAHARRLAARLFVRAGRLGRETTSGYRRLAPGRAGQDGDLDLDLTFEVAGGRPRHADELVARRWVAPQRALCLLVDHSGSMHGHAVGLAAMASAAVVLTHTERATTSVIAFAKDALVLQAQDEPRPPAALVDDLLSLRGQGRTDLALALRTAAAQLASRPAADRHVILLSDCRRTAGGDPHGALAGLDRVDVLGTSADPEAVAAGRALAARARGCYRLSTNYVTLRAGLLTLLS